MGDVSTGAPAGWLDALSWPFEPWWIGALWIGQLAAAVGYVLRVRRLPGAGPRPVLDGGFAAAWLLAGLVLSAPEVFRPGARELLDASGIPAALHEVDAQIEQVERLPAVLWEALRGPFGWALDETPPLETVPLRGERPVAARVQPALEAWTLLWIRTALYLPCLGVMGLAWLARRGASLRERVRDLEQRVAALEAPAPGIERPPFTD